MKETRIVMDASLEAPFGCLKTCDEAWSQESTVKGCPTY